MEINCLGNLLQIIREIINCSNKLSKIIRIAIKHLSNLYLII